MLFIVLLIAFLALLAGFIAYTGDVLGTIIGKRRLSLFGVRPKLTGRIIGVSAGVLIMITTATVLALTFTQATNVVQRYQNFLFENRTLQASQRQLQRQLGDLENQLTIQQQKLAEIQAEADRLQLSNNQLNQLNGSLENLNEQLTLDIEETQAQFLRQQEQALNLNNRLEQSAQQLSNLQEQIRALESGGLTYTAGQVIHSAVIAVQEPLAIREVLAQFFREALNKATLRGVDQLRPLSSEDIDVFVEEIMLTPSSDILIFSSPRNQFRGAVLDYSFALLENSKILSKGQLVSSQQIHLGSRELPVGREDIGAELARLALTTRNRLLRLNAATDISFETTGLAPDIFAEQLLRLKGPVTIGMIASEDIFVAGPAELEFLVIY